MESLAVVFILQVLRISVPYLFASVGAIFSERGGVINLALEGLILAGAFGAMLGQYLTGSAWAGIGFALALGLVVSLLHAFVTITLRADQIVSGIAINILVMGATRFGLGLLFGSAMNSARIAGMEVSVPLFDPLLVIAVFTVGVAQFVLFRTPYGLRLRAAGESAKAVETAGLDVRRLRYSGVLISGALAALGGVFLAFQQHSFTDNMSAGRGYIALAAMIIGRWSPAGAALASLLFAAAEAMSMWLPSGWLPSQLVQSLPYLITLLVLAGFVGKSAPPKELGVPYEPE
ncbi:MAG TPA: ABC transporter permease [Chlorobaculum sp.]|jgi:simple sugar transport system permease protein|uniref:ABC transporter, permease protein n=1 Tax=Chlorobaculum tepidum (strain ATCC 49652 / DSM 12025 / NBRC 103806 / TLS) TaxID=194439 RepID=Q8KBV1_CHLTE|nr:ABC transporter permease [Chlorobaculum tepidum]AAM72906.1 ABC transporter, permease protein [Chlorobaculum tepidum TLS]HBU22534.1 ABC transporter permease [Chlorobaculum sp.]